MCTFEQNFKRAIEDLCKDRNYHVDYIPPQVCIIARIRGGSSGRKVEVVLTGKEYLVRVPETAIKKSFAKNELDFVIDCIRDILEE
ncbi:MAG TPA: hypothetical protein HPP66_08690 [Planctomycetes bacterium]|nr:hypothetical protein [Planctomycetota bacterium]